MEEWGRGRGGAGASAALVFPRTKDPVPSRRTGRLPPDSCYVCTIPHPPFWLWSCRRVSRGHPVLLTSRTISGTLHRDMMQKAGRECATHGSQGHEACSWGPPHVSTGITTPPAQGTEKDRPGQSGSEEQRRPGGLSLCRQLAVSWPCSSSGK